MAKKSHLGGVDLKNEVYIANPASLSGVPDLCMMTYLSEGNVVVNLNQRYSKPDPKQRCYTSMTAKVLVAVNPYERMDVNYTDDVMRAYQERPTNLEGLVGVDDLPPHVYTVANSAFQNLLAQSQNQSIIVCGESGSGKTESAKYMMRFLAFTCTSTSVDPAEFAEAEAIGTQVLDANPILESFGNAKTLINNNSSRFGKFTKLVFVDAKTKDKRGNNRKRLIGAAIESYLLEKSRVVFQEKGERNYHIFYQLTHMHKQRPELKLAPPTEFLYTSRAQCTELDDLRYPGALADAEWFKELTQAFKTLLVAEDQVSAAYAVVAGILHMGNLKFAQRAGEGSDIANTDVLETCAELLGVDTASLRNRLETRTMYLPGDKTIIKTLGEEDAMFNRDSLARNLYNGLFRWIVHRINQQSSKDTEGAGVSWIGILDVFGFEIFENNSFEQFCINFANERLQQYFNHHVLQAEQDLYKREALLWDPIDLPDNKDCISLIMDKPFGVFPVLDSACVQPKGSGETFVDNLFQGHKFHPRLRRAKPRKVNESDRQMTQICGFSIRHYAGEVTYNCERFLEKNSDASEFDSLLLFESSKNSIARVALRFLADGTIDKAEIKKNTKRAFLSTGSVFCEQLTSLMNELKKTAPYFVRCIKPNADKKARIFTDDFVRPQLRCGGLIEALRIIKLGFPTRCSYKRVHEIFGEILRKKPVTNLNLRDFTEGVMHVLGSKEHKLSSDEYQLGLTMVFFRPGKQQYLTDILEKSPKDVTEAQTAEIRQWLIKKRWLRARGTGRAWVRSAKFVQEMRFKKAAASMVIIYRVFGRALTDVRNKIDGVKKQQDYLKNHREAEFKKTQAQLEELQALAAKKDAELNKFRQEATASIAQKDAEIESSNAKLNELKQQQRALKDQLEESNSKRLALHNETKAKISDLESRLAAESGELTKLKQQQREWADAKDEYEGQLEKNRNAISDLRHSMGLGSAEYEKQIEEKERSLADLRDRVRGLEDQSRMTKESLGGQMEELKQQLERSRADAREEKAHLENLLRERDATNSRLQSELSMLKTSSEQKIKDLQDALEESGRDSKANKDRLSKQLNERNEELNDVKKDIALMQGKLEAAVASNNESQKRSAEQVEEYQTRLNEQKEQHNREAKKLEQRLADALRDLAVAKDQVETARRELGASQGGSSEKIAVLERALKDKETEAEELREELARTKAKFDALQRESDAKIASLQDDVAKARADARDQQARLEREAWEKSNELANVRSELAIWKDKAEADKERADSSSKSSMDQLAQERELAAQRLAKAMADLTAKSDDLRELKADYKAEKREWRNKQEKYEKSVTALEAAYDALQDQQLANASKQSDAEKAGKEAVADAELKAAKDAQKLKTTIDELREDIKEAEEARTKAMAEKQKAVQDGEMAAQGFREREQKYRDDIARLKSEIDNVENDFIQYKQSAADEVEQKLSALQGQVALLQSLVDDLKADKIEAKEREYALQDQLREAHVSASESRAALKALQNSHNAELDKLRLALDAAREKALLDADAAREQQELTDRKLFEKESLVAELKQELAETTEREITAQDALRDAESNGKDEQRKLALRAAQLEEERLAWQRSKAEFERKLGDAEHNRVMAQTALSEAEHKKSMSDSSKGEVAVLKARLAASEKALVDREKAFARQLALKEDEWKQDHHNFAADFDRQLKQRDEEANSRNEAYKYKLQYLELSQKDLRTERKKWEDKEKEYERALIALTGELRELRADHQQAVDVADAYRAHVEAKDAARSVENSSYDIKKQALGAEHSLGLKQQSVEKDARIAQLERELFRVKAELNDALAEIDSLAEGLDNRKAASMFRNDDFASPRPYESKNNAQSATPVPQNAISPLPQNQSASGISLEEEDDRAAVDAQAQADALAAEEARLVADEAAADAEARARADEDELAAEEARLAAEEAALAASEQ